MYMYTSGWKVSITFMTIITVLKSVQSALFLGICTNLLKCCCIDCQKVIDARVTTTEKLNFKGDEALLPVTTPASNTAAEK